MYIINQLVINYHTFSFTLYDIALHDKNSLLNNVTTFGLASSGFIEQFFSLLLRLMGLEITPLYREIGISLNDFQEVGYSAEGGAITANAYGSILYTLYMDGGLGFIFCFGALFGFVLAKLSTKALTSKNIFIMSQSLFLLYMLMFGLFQPILSGNISSVSFILIAIYLVGSSAASTNGGVFIHQPLELNSKI